jgi:YNFM family putative membrane transporter
MGSTMALISALDGIPLLHAWRYRAATTGKPFAVAGGRALSLRPIGILSTAAFCVAACLRITDPLLPDVARAFGVGIGAASVVVTAFAFAYGLAQVAYGPIGDRFGKYGVIAGAMTLSALFIAAAATAPTLMALAWLRLAAGASTAAILPLALAYVGDVVPYEHRQAVLARILSGQLLGVIFGQAAGGVLIGYVSWRIVFLILGAIFAVVASLLWIEFRSPRVVRLRAPAPLAPGALIRQYAALAAASRSRAVLLAIFVEGFLFFGMLAYFGAFLRRDFAIGYVAVGLILGCFGLGGLAYSLAARRIVPRFGEAGMMRLGGLGLAAGLLALALVPSWSGAVPVMAALGFALYMFHNTLQTKATQMAPASRGAAVSLFYSCFFLGQAIGAPLIGVGIERCGYGFVFTTAGIGLLALGRWFARQF